MKQWFTFIFSFFSFLAVVLIILILILGNKPYSDIEKQAIERAKNDDRIEEVDRAYVYSGQQSAVTVIGTDSEGALKAVFVPKGEDKELSETALYGKTTAKEARGIAFEDMDVKKVLHTKLGMDTEGPVWEVAFLTANDRLNYVYVMADGGSIWKRILNL